MGGLVPVENRSCGRRTSSPTAAAEPASPLVGSIDPTPSEYLALRTPPSGLGNFHPPHRFRFVGPTQQLVSDDWPVLLQVVGDSADGHAIDARAVPLCSLPPAAEACLRFPRSQFPPSFDSCWLGFRGHASPRAIGLFSFASQASPDGEDEKSSVTWVFFCRLSLLRFMSDLPLLLVPAFGHRFPAQPICCSTFRIGVPH